MPRRSGVPKREIIADPIYNSTVVTKLINQVMKDGKRGTAQRICYDAFEIIKEKTGKDAIEVFDQAMENIMPVLEVKARRVGGATYQVPIEVRPERRQTLAIRWLVFFSQTAGSIFARKFFYKRVGKLLSPQGKIPLFLVPESGGGKKRIFARFCAA